MPAACSPRACCRPTPRSCRSRADSPCGSRAAAACCRASRCAAAPGMPASRQLPHEQGGAVNAIEKMSDRARAPCERLREHWALRPRHPYLSARRLRADHHHGRRVARLLPGRRARSSATSSTSPTAPTSTGYGSAVEREFEHWIAEAAARDPWLREHPPEIAWGAGARAAGRGRRQTIRSCRRCSAAGRDLGQLEQPRRPRQLARRRDAHGRGRDPGGLLRPGRRPPRPHGRRVRADRRPRRVRSAHRAGGHALLQLSAEVRMPRGQARTCVRA